MNKCKLILHRKCFCFKWFVDFFVLRLTPIMTDFYFLEPIEGCDSLAIIHRSIDKPTVCPRSPCPLEDTANKHEVGGRCLMLIGTQPSLTCWDSPGRPLHLRQTPPPTWRRPSRAHNPDNNKTNTLQRVNTSCLCDVYVWYFNLTWRRPLQILVTTNSHNLFTLISTGIHVYIVQANLTVNN